jgi:hypothetical protein
MLSYLQQIVFIRILPDVFYLTKKYSVSYDLFKSKELLVTLRKFRHILNRLLYFQCRVPTTKSCLPPCTASSLHLSSNIISSRIRRQVISALISKIARGQVIKCTSLVHNFRLNFIIVSKAHGNREIENLMTIVTILESSSRNRFFIQEMSDLTTK